MAWERFHHICRRSLASLQAGESPGERVRAVESDPDTSLYGTPLRQGTLPRRILDGIVSQPDRIRARQLLDLYAGFDLSSETDQPLQLKRIAVYLAYVSVVFVAVNAIYQLKVAPQFMALFDTFEVSIPQDFALFREYGSVVATSVLLLLALALLMGHVVKGLADWSSRGAHSLAARFLVLPKARAAYADLEAALLYPLGEAVMDSDSRVVRHLRKLEQEGLDIRNEIVVLARSRHRRLVELCEKQMRVVYAFCVVLIVAMLFQFLVSAYSPIFMMGETI